MAKKKVKKASVKETPRKSSGLVKFLETVVVVGAVAGVLMKLFKGGKPKKK